MVRKRNFPSSPAALDLYAALAFPWRRHRGVHIGAVSEAVTILLKLGVTIVLIG